ncbi:terminase large subunit domain-containing protein [Halomarina rubra]|uniref:Terminase large subunit domain-containing protein n=1 Tax=Halomarina rubra TaxID=2071873 RepID=A0ABD6B0E3_9EURY|nr:terminase family protein [Halomarina rubra]
MSTTNAVDEVRLEWSPHPGQQDILSDDSRFKIVACGRRWGKTECAAKWLVGQALAPEADLVWWVGPGYEVVDPGYYAVLDTLPDRLIADTKESKPYHIDLVYGARIAFRTTKSDSNVGVGLDALVIDEAAQVSKQRWTRDLRPTLSDTLGKMMAISTPRGRNWFHDYFQRGQSPDHDDVASWTAPTYDNPHIPDSEVDAARDEVPERVFQQEYLAEFIDDAGGVFERVRDRIVEDYHLDETEGSGPYATGVDFARHQDYTVIHTLDSKGITVYHERLRNVSWPQIQRRVETAAGTYPGTVAVDASRDNKIVGDLAEAGVNVRPVKFTAPRKRQLVENLVTQIEQEAVTIPDLPVLVTELQLFEYDVTKAGNVRYHAPEGHHDDCVDAFALAADARHRTPQDTNRSFARSF